MLLILLTFKPQIFLEIKQKKMMGDKFIWDTNQQRKVFDRIYNSFKKSLNENAEKELFNRFLSSNL